VSAKHLRHDCRLPPSNFRLLCQVAELEIHFNTARIVGDLENILVDPRFVKLRSLSKCKLWCLRAHEMPLVLDESDFQAVVDGMRGIFPSIQAIEGLLGTWSELSGELQAQ